MSSSAAESNDVSKKQPRALDECPDCHQRTLDKVTTPLGLLCCLGCWWMCCLGCCCMRCCRDDFCETCYVEKFYEKAKERRRTKLIIDDRSLYSQPRLDEAVKEGQPEVLLRPKSD